MPCLWKPLMNTSLTLPYEPRKFENMESLVIKFNPETWLTSLNSIIVYIAEDAVWIADLNQWMGWY